MSNLKIRPKVNRKKKKNILYALKTEDEFAKTNNIPETEFNDLLNTSKKSLLTERNKRTRPAVDDKILTSWNALMLKAYADAYTAFGNDIFLKKALNNASFLE